MNKYGDVVFYVIFLILFTGFTECRLMKDVGHSKKDVVDMCKTVDGTPIHCDKASTAAKANTTTKVTTENPTEMKPEQRKTTVINKAVETTKIVTVPSVETTQNMVVTTAIPAKTTEDPTNVLTDLNRKETSKIDTGSAALAAGICVTIALAGYASLMIYRKLILQRYGNSEILLNEDDVADIQDEDMKHFELKLMDKDGNVIEP